jgi:hypothetical protein
MSNKASRRPSWKNYNGAFFTQLVNEETNKVFCRVRIRDKKTRRNFQWIIGAYGMETAQKMLEGFLIEEANRVLDDIAIASLKEAYRHNCKPDKIDCSDEVMEVDFHFLGAVDEVLDYFLNAEQKKVWDQEKKDMLK